MEQFPKMIYRTREEYKIVGSEFELEESLKDGWKLHWLDEVQENKVQEPKVKEKKKRVNG